MIRVYIQKWDKKADAPWENLLAGILKRDYGLECCPEILRDEWGKPYFQGAAVKRSEEFCEKDSDLSLQFNVSHSGEYLALAISEGPVGIDIQESKEIREGMFRKVVQPEEQCLIGEERQRDFLRLWALKESFVKAEGKGLRISMKDYYFGCEGNSVFGMPEKKTYFVNYHGQKAAWLFNIEEELIEGYFISVCGLETEVDFFKEDGG